MIVISKYETQGLKSSLFFHLSSRLPLPPVLLLPLDPINQFVNPVSNYLPPVLITAARVSETWVAGTLELISEDTNCFDFSCIVICKLCYL